MHVAWCKDFSHSSNTYLNISSDQEWNLCILHSKSADTLVFRIRRGLQHTSDSKAWMEGTCKKRNECMRLICVHLKIETVHNAVQSWNLFLAVYIGRKHMFSRSPVRLCGLVRKLWHAEKGICALFLAGATSKNVNFKEERLQNTYRPQGKLCQKLCQKLFTQKAHSFWCVPQQQYWTSLWDANIPAVEK